MLTEQSLQNLIFNPQIFTDPAQRTPRADALWDFWDKNNGYAIINSPDLGRAEKLWNDLKINLSSYLSEGDKYFINKQLQTLDSAYTQTLINYLDDPSGTLGKITIQNYKGFSLNGGINRTLNFSAVNDSDLTLYVNKFIDAMRLIKFVVKPQMQVNIEAMKVEIENEKGEYISKFNYPTRFASGKPYL